MSLDTIIDSVLDREKSKYTDDPADRGGPTKYGVTLGDWQLYTGKPAVAADIMALTEPQAREYYRWRYIIKPGFDTIDDPWLQEFIIDTGVLEGRETATKMLQKILGVQPDGIFGPITRNALINFSDFPLLRRTLLITRVHHLIGCALEDERVPRHLLNETNLRFLHGWWNRAASFLKGM